MGIYLNPGNALLKKLTNSKIYIDKSLLIKELNELVNTGDCFVCVSRPRFWRYLRMNRLFLPSRPQKEAYLRIVTRSSRFHRFISI